MYNNCPEQLISNISSNHKKLKYYLLSCNSYYNFIELSSLDKIRLILLFNIFLNTITNIQTDITNTVNTVDITILYIYSTYNIFTLNISHNNKLIKLCIV